MCIFNLGDKENPVSFNFKFFHKDQPLCAAAAALPAWKEQEAVVASLVPGAEAAAPHYQEWPACNWMVAEGQAGPAP